jgi:hypothetical protein
MSRYKVGDIVLIKSVAGDLIPHIHVKLLKRVIIKPTKGKSNGFRKTMDWPGYSGWDTEIVFQSEADNLRKNWSIPFEGPGDKTFVYDSSIIKKPRNPSENKEVRKKKTITRKKK